MASGVTVSEAHVSYSQQYRRCNKRDCRVCQLGAPGHGPYWYAYWREDGRLRSRYLGKHAPPVALAAALDGLAGSVT